MTVKIRTRLVIHFHGYTEVGKFKPVTVRVTKVATKYIRHR